MSHNLRETRLVDYQPQPMLRRKLRDVAKAAFPVIDAHNHLGRWLQSDWPVSDVGSLIDLMDASNIRAIVNLDGMWGDELAANLERYDLAHPGRFVTLCQLDWSTTSEPGFGDRLSAQLARSLESGAKGVKVWKNLGLKIRDDRGELVMPDDERLAPIWEVAAHRHVPVLIHVGDPLAFFEPLDARNERLEELLENPDWWFGDSSLYPAFERIFASFERLIAAHPGTTFIGAHVGCLAEELDEVDRILATYPNFFVDVAARIAELGRQPRRTRELILKHPQRVLFGTDLTPPSADIYSIHFRFLETEDEYFPYDPDEPPSQGRWAISGLGLPAEVLQKVYWENASGLMGGIG